MFSGAPKTAPLRGPMALGGSALYHPSKYTSTHTHTHWYDT